MYYTSYLEIYVGMQPPGPYRVDNSPSSVVERFCELIRGAGRSVTTDNWFKSVEQMKKLKVNYRLTLLDTIRENSTLCVFLQCIEWTITWLVSIH